MHVLLVPMLCNLMARSLSSMGNRIKGITIIGMDNEFMARFIQLSSLWWSLATHCYVSLTLACVVYISYVTLVYMPSSLSFLSLQIQYQFVCESILKAYEGNFPHIY